VSEECRHVLRLVRYEGDVALEHGPMLGWERRLQKVELVIVGLILLVLSIALVVACSRADIEVDVTIGEAILGTMFWGTIIAFPFVVGILFLLCSLEEG